MRTLRNAALGLLFLAAPFARAADDAIDVREDFDAATVPAAWRVSTAAWRPAEGALRGTGGGQFDLVQPIGGDFELTFDASTSEKANVEVHLVDPSTGATRLTFAFLGRYHSVLKGARCCILADQGFVSVMPEMWIWPGHRFAFRVRRAGAALTTFLDGVAGPAWTDSRPQDATDPLALRIVVSPETVASEVVIDSIRVHAGKPVAPAAAPAPAPAPAPQQQADPASALDLDVAKTRNLVVHNHFDATYVTATVAEALQRQHDFLRQWVGVAPETIHVHFATDYPCGFARPTEKGPEMFLKAGSIFDTSADYAHEMLHCFLFRYGNLPHWFGESMADMAYADSEISLWKRRTEAGMLKAFDRVEERSFELAKLRMKFGKDYFPRVCRGLEKNLAKCQATFRPGVPVADQNELLLSILSDAAGEDLRPLFRDTFGFDAKTRERQRGY